MVNNFLDADIKSQVAEFFKQLENPVSLLFFKKEDSTTCNDTRQLVEEVASISDKLSFIVYDVDADSQISQKFNVDKTPSVVVVGKKGDDFVDYGLRYAGMPSGHEFGAFINDLVHVSKGDSSLGQSTRQYLANLEKPIKFLVFYTPTCPHCPRAVALAHQFAIESPMVQAEAISAMEFFDLSNKYEVSGVPHTAILDGDGKLIHTVIGGMPEQYMLDELKSIIN